MAKRLSITGSMLCSVLCVSLESHLPQGKAKNIRVIANDKFYHVKCYKCEVCVCVRTYMCIHVHVHVVPCLAVLGFLQSAMFLNAFGNNCSTFETLKWLANMADF